MLLLCVRLHLVSVAFVYLYFLSFFFLLMFIWIDLWSPAVGSVWHACKDTTSHILSACSYIQLDLS